MVRETDKVWAQNPHPWRVFPGTPSLERKGASCPRSFHFATNCDITLFKCQDRKDFFIWLWWKPVFCWSARFSHHFPPPGYASVFKAWCKIHFSSELPLFLLFCMVSRDPLGTDTPRITRMHLPIHATVLALTLASAHFGFQGLETCQRAAFTKSQIPSSYKSDLNLF